MLPASDNEDESIEGETTPEDEVVPKVSFDVTSYGSDPEVEGLVNRLRRQAIVIPDFQRAYVWRQPEASKFIESLLLGLPVPGLFFAVDPETGHQLVIDGQQRLKTLQFFYDGYFNPNPASKTQKVFTLTKVQKPFEGLTYKTLPQSDRNRLDTAIIHATTVKQTAPPGDDTSLYHIFERLNSGGRRLTDQEMRVALYHGKLIELTKDLNSYPSWRKIFGKRHSRLKDQELILRFFALFHTLSQYHRPLSEFLNKYAGKHRNPTEARLSSDAALFKSTIDNFDAALTTRPFRLTTSLNVAVFDSCMVGLAKRLTATKKPPDKTNVRKAYHALLSDKEYMEAVSRSTADPIFVNRRLKKAADAFSEC